MIIQYARNENRVPSGVLVAEKVVGESTVLVGWSACRAPDKFDKDTALKIARGRIALGASGATVPRNMRPMLPSFEDRCRRYFKTGCVIVVGGTEEVMHER